MLKEARKACNILVGNLKSMDQLGTKNIERRLI
jgi:hypothetical protein